MSASNPNPARRILITGVTRGLGCALAEAFIAQGHTLIGCARNEQAIAQLRRTHAAHHFTAVDVADDAQVAAWAHEVLSIVGAPELLLNATALINPPAPLWTIPAADFDRVIDTNIKGVANVIRHFVPAMISTGRGVVVNFSSGWGRSTDAGVAPYCASKWAIEGLTRALAQELPKGMAAIPLNPGIIDTDMLRQSFADAAGNYPSPEEWARRAAPFLLKLAARDNGRPLDVP